MSTEGTCIISVPSGSFPRPAPVNTTDGTLFTFADSNAFKTLLKVEINPSQIDLRQEIMQIGKYKININLHAEVTANVNLHIDKIDSI